MSIFIACLILGAGISWTKGWVIFVWSIIKKCQGKNGVSNKLVVEVEHGLQLTQSRCSDKTDDLGPECMQGVSTTRFGLTQENTLSSRSLRKVLKATMRKQKEMEKQIAKIDKQMEETIRLQHLETKRRFERLEKKTNGGYFN